MVHRQCTRAKPFSIYPVTAAGEFVMDDEPEWLRLWEGPLTKEEKMIYKKFVPEGIEYFDRAKKIFNAELRIPLTIFKDKEGAKISFSQEWDMVVAEHVRAVIASERPRRENELVNDDTDDSAGNDSDVSLTRPFLDSSGDFTGTSEEDEEEEEEWPRVHPVAPVYRIYSSDSTLIPFSNLPSIYQSDMAPSTQLLQSAAHRPHHSAPHQPHKSSLHQPHQSAPHQPHQSAPHQPHQSAPHQPHHSAPRQPHHSAPRQPHHSAPRQPYQSAPRQPHLSALHQPHYSAHHPPHYSAHHQPHYSAHHQPHYSAHHQPHHSALHQLLSQANFQPILFYYHGRTPAFYKTLPRANNPSQVSGLDRLVIDSWSTAEGIFESTNHFSFIMGPFVPFLYYLMLDLTENEVREVFTLLPSVPDIKALVALHESNVLKNASANRRLLNGIVNSNQILGDGRIPSRPNPTLAGTSALVNSSVFAGREAPIARNFGLVGSHLWTPIAGSYGSSLSGLDEFEDFNFEIPYVFVQRQPQHLPSDPKEYTFEDSVRCRTKLDIAIKNETLAAAKNLASIKSKVDMVQKLEETSSIELAKQFLKTPDAAFVLHDVYRKPGEKLGIRSVPRPKVFPDAFESGSFITLKALGESVEDGDLENFFVDYWSEALEMTKGHFLAHEETLRALQDVFLNDEADSKIINSHLNCLRMCIPYFTQQLDLHKEKLNMVSCVLTIKEYNIGKQLLEALKTISEYKPPETIRANYVLTNLAQSASFDLDGDEEFSDGQTRCFGVAAPHKS